MRDETRRESEGELRLEEGRRVNIFVNAVKFPMEGGISEGLTILSRRSLEDEGQREGSQKASRGVGGCRGQAGNAQDFDLGTIANHANAIFHTRIGCGLSTVPILHFEVLTHLNEDRSVHRIGKVGRETIWDEGGEGRGDRGQGEKAVIPKRRRARVIRIMSIVPMEEGGEGEKRKERRAMKENRLGRNESLPVHLWQGFWGSEVTHVLTVCV